MVLHTRLAAIAVLACAIATPQEPRPVTPGKAGQPPSDAIVLFNGKDLSEWTHEDGRPASWALGDGAMICKTGTGHIITKRKIGSAQIHVEFSTPNMPNAKSQAKANSGVYLQSRYEVQVLDSYKNPTYAKGECGALYSQYSPLVNACLPPEQWQTYDIIFHAPKCGPDGSVNQPGTLTVLQNGVLIQDHVTIKGITPGGTKSNVCEPGPLKLQDHYHPDVKETFMRFRNIWYRPLAD